MTALQQTELFMATRTSVRNLGNDRAEFSADGRYRYFLQRSWNQNLPVWLFIGANPSKAGQPDGRGGLLSDATISGQVNRARALGYGTVWAVNARAWISTDPKLVPTDPEAIGPENDAWVERAVSLCDLVVCAWGHLGADRGPRILEIVRAARMVPHALALTADGTPRHPRGMPSSARPFPMRSA